MGFVSIWNPNIAVIKMYIMFNKAISLQFQMRNMPSESVLTLAGVICGIGNPKHNLCLT